jgi:hypothetical protein
MVAIEIIRVMNLFMSVLVRWGEFSESSKVVN